MEKKSKIIYPAKPTPMTKEAKAAFVQEMMDRYRKTIAYLAR